MATGWNWRTPSGRWMARAGAELLAYADLVVPIPLHRKRLFSRRFNQAALLAQVVAARRSAPAIPSPWRA
jgi:predicted amidophosphoribosyltransferase